MPFGTDWWCVECWARYPDDTPEEVCPVDGGHLHRAFAAGGGRVPTLDEMKRALRQLHEREIAPGVGFVVTED
jgi:hypothetical protein